MQNTAESGVRGLDDLIGKLPQGSCILLIAPPKAETHLFCLEFVYRGLEKGVPGLILTMDNSPEMLKQKAAPYGFLLQKKEDEGLLKWIDGYSINANKDIIDTPTIDRVDGPLALTDTSIALTQAQAQIHSLKDNYRFVFDSLSTMLIYNSPDTMFRFLEVVIAKTRASGGTGIFVLGEGMHDKKIEMTIRHIMDGALKMDDSLNLEVLALPTPGKLKKGKLELTESGFLVSVEGEEAPEAEIELEKSPYQTQTKQKRDLRAELEKLRSKRPKTPSIEIGVWSDSKRPVPENTAPKNPSKKKKKSTKSGKKIIDTGLKKYSLPEATQ